MWLYTFIRAYDNVADLEDFANYVNAQGYEMTFNTSVPESNNVISYSAVFQFSQGATLPAIPFAPPV